jgi:hypothetical protein
MIYAYEGEGSDAGSLSSIGSMYTDDDQEFDHLQDWGPKFSKLAKLYKTNNNNGINPHINTVMGEDNYLNFGFDKNV